MSRNCQVEENLGFQLSMVWSLVGWQEQVKNFFNKVVDSERRDYGAGCLFSMKSVSQIVFVHQIFVCLKKNHVNLTKCCPTFPAFFLGEVAWKTLNTA